MVLQSIFATSHLKKYRPASWIVSCWWHSTRKGNHWAIALLSGKGFRLSPPSIRRFCAILEASAILAGAPGLQVKHAVLCLDIGGSGDQRLSFDGESLGDPFGLRAPLCRGKDIALASEDNCI